MRARIAAALSAAHAGTATLGTRTPASTSARLTPTRTVSQTCTLITNAVNLVKSEADALVLDVTTRETFSQTSHALNEAEDS